MLSPRKELRRQFTHKEKGKKKMSEYEFGSAESDRLLRTNKKGNFVEEFEVGREDNEIG